MLSGKINKYASSDLLLPKVMRMEKKLVGTVSHYFNKAGVAVVELSADVKVGDKVSFEGGHSFEQTIESMQVEHKNISEAKKGQAIGMKTADHVREGYQVYKITE